MTSPEIMRLLDVDRSGDLDEDEVLESSIDLSPIEALAKLVKAAVEQDKPSKAIPHPRKARSLASI